jgi:chitinase
MGSHHDSETAGGDYGAYSYSRGYRLTVSSTSGFATVMAYSDGPQTQLNRFSNPAVAACMSRPCGVAGSSDNARSLTNTAAAVAAFRAATTSTPALPSLAVANASVVEGNSGTRALTFRVTLSAASATAVSFDVATANGTATAGSDYVAVPATRLTIAAGATTRDVSVVVNGDTAVEASETLALNLGNASGATVADASGTGTITNDDATSTAPATPSLSVSDASVAEGNSGTRSIVFRVALAAPAPTTVSYDVYTENGSATAGSDYAAVPRTRLSIPAGSTYRDGGVTVLGDTAVEGNETFALRIANASGATIADDAGTGTIANDDGAAPTGPGLRIADASVVEGDGGTVMLAFVVSLSQPSATTVNYTISTADGTARAGSDYSARVNATQSIPAGVTSRNFNVIVTPDLVDELNETLTARILSASTSIVDGQATGTIIDDD